LNIAVLQLAIGSNRLARRKRRKIVDLIVDLLLVRGVFSVHRSGGLRHQTEKEGEHSLQERGECSPHG
jgi:hypothetical protein